MHWHPPSRSRTELYRGCTKIRLCQNASHGALNFHEHLQIRTVSVHGTTALPTSLCECRRQCIGQCTQASCAMCLSAWDNVGENVPSTKYVLDSKFCHIQGYTRGTNLYSYMHAPYIYVELHS